MFLPHNDAKSYIVWVDESRGFDALLKAGFLNVGTVIIWLGNSLLWGCPMHPEMFGSIASL